MNARDLKDRLKDCNVLVTGHTGFKGAWLCLWLDALGAEVHGFARAEDPSPAAYSALGVGARLASERIGELADPAAFASYFEAVRPRLVFHLAAQSLVRASYREPIETVRTNVLGTAHVLEAVRGSPSDCACVVVTSDKCYELEGVAGPRREGDPLGGPDLYSASKAAAELITAAYRRSFFAGGSVRVATARAGNVIGGGDCSPDRLVPDCIRALRAGAPIGVRNPESTRPWQHVLEPLSGYLALGARLLEPASETFCDAWNFGPRPGGDLSVQQLVEQVIAAWGSGSWREAGKQDAPHEARALSLAVDRARDRLGWLPTWDTPRAVRETVAWYKAFEADGRRSAGLIGSMRELSLAQIASFTGQK